MMLNDINKISDFQKDRLLGVRFVNFPFEEGFDELNNEHNDELNNELNNESHEFVIKETKELLAEVPGI